MGETEEMTEQRRRRLSADESQARILEAAQRQLEAVGPAGLRLKDLAAELGISHQAILHHFGSKERLIAAVVERAFDVVNDDLARAVEQFKPGELNVPDLLRRGFSTISPDKGRLLTWLVLSGEKLAPHEGEAPPLSRLAMAAHALRQADGEKSLDDTRFVVVLSALAVLSQGVFFDQVLEGVGLGEDPEAADRFRTWFAELVVAHLRKDD